MKKSVTFNPRVEVMIFQAEGTMNKLVVQQKHNRSFAHIDLELQQRKNEAIMSTREDINSTRRNLSVVKDILKTLTPSDKGYVYYRDLKSDTLFELSLLISKMKYYKNN